MEIGKIEEKETKTKTDPLMEKKVLGPCLKNHKINKVTEKDERMKKITTY